MCVRFSGVSVEDQAAKAEYLANNFADVVMPGDRFPGDEAKFVATGGEILLGRWGLQPTWAKEADFGKRSAYNARAETVAEKPTFRSAFRHRRCVVPASAFYERAAGRWLRIAPAADEPFAIAGLWEEPNEHTHGLPTFTMVTTEPNASIGEVHDRMPVVLAASDVEGWIASRADIRDLNGLLVPCPPEWMRVEDAGPVGKRRRVEEPGLF